MLPGFDAALPAAVWERLAADDAGAADHPQHGLPPAGGRARLRSRRRCRPGTRRAPPAPARNALVSLALRPAPVTDQWRSEGGGAGRLARAAAAGLTWVEAPDPRAEALAIALALREAAETGTRAALVTPDRTLARRVTAELDRWGLIPDDSAGRPLALTPPGVLLRRLAALPGAPLTPGGAAGAAQASAGGQRARRARRAPAADRAAGDRAPARRARRGRLGRPRAPGRRRAADARRPGSPGCAAALAPLAAGGAAPLAEHVARHRAAAEALAAGPGGRGARALGEGGRAAGAGAARRRWPPRPDAGGAMGAGRVPRRCCSR